MPVLGRAQILSAADLKQERVDVPEWGGEVIVQEVSAAAAVALGGWAASMASASAPMPACTAVISAAR